MPKISRKETKLRDEITEKLKKISSEKHVEKAKEKIDSKKHRRRKSRWSTEFDRVLIPGLPVALAGIELTPDQLRIYIMQLKVEEISLKLRTGNLGIPVNPDSRSPSPEPVYNTQGVRLNTREIRVRQKLEEERHVLVRILEEKNSEYRPPPDYKIPANKLTDKVFIPQERYPHINFIGLLIGPRGNTLKRLETDTNCKIIIRGQGSMKEGKSRLAPMPGEDEPLHALITAPSEVALAKGISTIKRIVKDGIDCPDGNNELRQMQLRELAEINGTMLGAEIARCRNCGATDHRHWECTETQNFTNMLTCSRCGGTGHLEIDCIYDGEKIVTAAEKAKMDDEYQTLMKELGVNTGETDFFMMPGLPRSLIKDLPWASSANNFLNRGDSTTFTVGPSGPLAISNTPFNPDTIEGGAPYIPGAAPMPSFTVRTLLSQDNTLPSVAMPPLAPWPMYPGYPYQAYPPPNPTAISKNYYPPTSQQQPQYSQVSIDNSMHAPPPPIPSSTTEEQNN